MNKSQSLTAADVELVEMLQARQLARSMSRAMPPEVQESVEYVSRLRPEQRSQLDQWAFGQMAALTPDQQAAVRYMLDRAFAFVVEEEADHKMLLEAVTMFTQTRRDDARDKLRPARKGIKEKEQGRLQKVREIMKSHDKNPGAWAYVVMLECNVSRPTAYRYLRRARGQLSHRVSP